MRYTSLALLVLLAACGGTADDAATGATGEVVADYAPEGLFVECLLPLAGAEGSEIRHFISYEGNLRNWNSVNSVIEDNCQPQRLICGDTLEDGVIVSRRPLGFEEEQAHTVVRVDLATLAATRADVAADGTETMRDEAITCTRQPYPEGASL